MKSHNYSDLLSAFISEIKDHSIFVNCPHVDAFTRGFGGDTPLKIAAVRENAEIVKALLKLGADPNNQGEDDCTPLHHASGGNTPEIVEVLLKYGASTSIQDRYGLTPLQYATNKEIVDILKKH